MNKVKKGKDFLITKNSKTSLFLSFSTFFIVTTSSLLASFFLAPKLGLSIFVAGFLSQLVLTLLMNILLWMLGKQIKRRGA
jgi:hypothetical protein